MSRSIDKELIKIRKEIGLPIEGPVWSEVKEAGEIFEFVMPKRHSEKTRRKISKALSHKCLMQRIQTKSLQRFGRR